MALAQHIMCWRFGRGAMACRLCTRHLCTRHRKAVVFQLLCMSCGPATWPTSCKNHDAGNGFVGRQKEQVRTAYAVLRRLGFCFNRVHALFIFGCDIEVLNVDSRTRESCGVFWKIRQGVVIKSLLQWCRLSKVGWQDNDPQTIGVFRRYEKIGCWPMLFPGESHGLNQKLLEGDASMYHVLAGW